jgi:uncharacterized membrane protein
MKVARLLLTVGYFVALLPMLFIGWAAYSDYNYRGCPGEAISQCSDAVSAIPIAIGYSAVSLLVLMLWLLPMFVGKRKDAGNA